MSEDGSGEIPEIVPVKKGTAPLNPEVVRKFQSQVISNEANRFQTRIDVLHKLVKSKPEEPTPTSEE